MGLGIAIGTGTDVAKYLQPFEFQTFESEEREAVRGTALQF